MRLIVIVCFVAGLIPAFGQGPQSSVTYDALISKARTLIIEKKPQEAVAVSQQAIALNEMRWEAYVTAASAYSFEQLYDDTIGMLQAALAHAPEERKPAIRQAITEARRQLAAQSNPQTGSSSAAGNQGASATPTQAEIVLWKEIENSTRAEDYQGYLSKYPDGTFAPVAKARVDAITSKQADEAAQQQQAKQAILAGSGWQGTIGDLTATLKFTDDHTCEVILVEQSGVSRLNCNWQKIGEALYVTGTPCSYTFQDKKGRWQNGFRYSEYVLNVQGGTASGLEKSAGTTCDGRKISLKRSE